MTTIVRTTATGAEDTFSVPFPYLNKSHVLVSVDGDLKVSGTDYTWPTSGTIQFVGGPPSAGRVVERRRYTPPTPITEYRPGNLDSADLNVSTKQPLYVAEEAYDKSVEDLAAASSSLNLAILAEAQDRVAGDAAVASLIGGNYGLERPDYDSRSALELANVAPTRTSLRTGGFLAAGDGGGALYKRVSSEPSHAAKEQSADGAWWELAENLVNVRQFGAAGNGSTDETTAIQAAIDYLLGRRTSPSGQTGHGVDVLFFPKGRYKCGPLTFGSSAIDMELRGAGNGASTIEFSNDDDAFITCNTFLNFRVRLLRIKHLAQDADASTWTNAFFRGNGTAGGRGLVFEDAGIYGFNRIVDNTGTVNGDTFSATRCELMDANKVFYARSSQAMINKFTNCTIYSRGDFIDVAGAGHTLVDTCNIVIDGTWLILHGATGLFGNTAQYLFVNVKGEPRNASAFGGGSRSGILRLAGDKSLVSGQVRFIGCGFESSVALDTDTAYPTIELNSKMNVDWQGGEIKTTAKIQLVGVQSNWNDGKTHRGLFFDGAMTAPAPTQINRVAGSGSWIYPQVVYERCNNVNNICIGADAASNADTFSPVALDRAVQVNNMAAIGAYNSRLTFGSALTHELDLYGIRQDVEDIIVTCTSRAAGDTLIETSIDEFATVLDTFAIPSGAGNTQPVSAKASDTMVGSKTQNWASLAAGGQQSTTVTVPGARVGDTVLGASMSVALSGTFLTAEVTADDTVTVYHNNPTAGAVDVSSGTLTVEVKRARVRTIVGKATTTGIQVRVSGGGTTYGYIHAIHRAR